MQHIFSPKRLLLAGALTLLATSQALAAPTPVFTVDPTSIAGTGSPFQADAINGFSSTRIRHDAGDPSNVYRATGYAFFNGFSNNGAPVPGGTSRINVDYGLYSVFTQKFTCSGALAPGVNCLSDELNFEMWADPGNDNTYTQSTVALDPQVIANGSQYKIAGTGALLGGIGGLDILGGAFQNLNFGWELFDHPTDPDGFDYFIGPNPFHTLAFTAFNNTSSGITCDTTNCVGASVVSINSEAGILDFNSVPEPGSLALLGFGLLGLAYSRRRNC